MLVHLRNLGFALIAGSIPADIAIAAAEFFHDSGQENFHAAQAGAVFAMHVEVLPEHETRHRDRKADLADEIGDGI